MGVWIETLLMPLRLIWLSVTPCMGVWIETRTLRRFRLGVWGHTLYGCVDWNPSEFEKAQKPHVTPCMGVWIETGPMAQPLSRWKVTPCMGVWIETTSSASLRSSARSHPVWVCGLKQLIQMSLQQVVSHTLYGCVDWNRYRHLL